MNWQSRLNKNNLQNTLLRTLTVVAVLAIGTVHAEPLSLLNWERINFSGANKISVVENTIFMDSDNSATPYYYEFAKPIVKPFTLACRWRASRVFSPEIHDKKRDDYAARVYIFFNGMLNRRALNYVLVDVKPPQDFWPNPYSLKSIMIPIGLQQNNTWQAEFVKPWQDYQHTFDTYPSKVVGIAVMSDTDDTGASVKAWYKNIEIDLIESTSSSF